MNRTVLVLLDTGPHGNCGISIIGAAAGTSRGSFFTDEYRQRNPDWRALASGIATVPGKTALLLFGSAADGPGAVSVSVPDLQTTSSYNLGEHVGRVTVAPNGEDIVAVMRSNYVVIWKRGADEPLVRLGSGPVAQDKPFISSAFFNGAHTLVYAVDCFWGDAGAVHVYDVRGERETASFKTGNGHSVCDVDFDRGLIVSTGNQGVLTVAGLDGVVSSTCGVGFSERPMGLAIDPTGDRLAVVDYTRAVHVYELVRGGLHP